MFGASLPELWDRMPALRRRIAMPFGDEVRLRWLVIALAALHDIGKFTLPFQMKVPELWLREFGPFPSQAPPDFRHDAAGAYLLKLRPIERILVGRLGSAWEALSAGLLQAIAGHHGRPRHCRRIACSGQAISACLRCPRPWPRGLGDRHRNVDFRAGVCGTGP